MAVLSGKSAAINGFSTLRNWNVNQTDSESSGFSFNSNPAQFGFAGNKDWNGSAQFYGNEPPVMPGAAISFIGYTGTNRWTGDAICESITLDCDIEGGGILGGTINFAGNGALAPGAGAAVTDSTAPAAASSIGCKASWDTGSEVDISDVRSWSLTITANNPSYASSTTAGIIKRVFGNWTATASVTLYEASSTAIIAPGTFGVLRLYVNASDAWEFEWMIQKNPAQTFDQEGAAVTGATYAFNYTGFKDVSGTFTKGSIVRPVSGAWF
jgi:hypothetical protein